MVMVMDLQPASRVDINKELRRHLCQRRRRSTPVASPAIGLASEETNGFSNGLRFLYFLWIRPSTIMLFYQEGRDSTFKKKSRSPFQVVSSSLFSQSQETLVSVVAFPK